MLDDTLAFWRRRGIGAPPHSRPLDPRLADFHALMQEKGCTTWADVTLDEVDDYWDSTSGAPGPRRTARMFIEGLLKWLVAEGRAPETVLQPRPKRPLEYVIDSDWKALHEQALQIGLDGQRGRNTINVRHRAYLSPLLIAAQSTHLHLSQVLEARMESADALGGAFEVDTTDWPVRVAPVIQPPADFSSLLTWYLNEREKVADGSSYLFLNGAGRRPSLEEALTDAQRLARGAGLSIELSDVALSDTYTMRNGGRFGFQNTNPALPNMPKKCWRHIESEWNNLPHR